MIENLITNSIFFLSSYKIGPTLKCSVFIDELFNLGEEEYVFRCLGNVIGMPIKKEAYMKRPIGMGPILPSMC